MIHWCIDVRDLRFCPDVLRGGRRGRAVKGPASQRELAGGQQILQKQDALRGTSTMPEGERSWAISSWGVSPFPSENTI